MLADYIYTDDKRHSVNVNGVYTITTTLDGRRRKELWWGRTLLRFLNDKTVLPHRLQNDGTFRWNEEIPY